LALPPEGAGEAPPLPGAFVRAEVTHAAEYDVAATLVVEAAVAPAAE
jgi:hypothetical protein